MDALARVSVVTAAATRPEELRQDTATALCGAFADWVFVDLIGSGPPRRAVAAVAADPALARTLARLPLDAAPLIAAAMRRQTPVIEATMGNKWLLGRLPDGTPVADAIDARSAAVGPIVTAEGTACGAITVVRTAARPYLRFVELGFLCHIAELTGVAARRLGQ